MPLFNVDRAQFQSPLRKKDWMNPPSTKTTTLFSARWMTHDVAWFRWLCPSQHFLLELKQEVYIMAALRGCRLNLVVNFLKYVVSLRTAALAGFRQLLRTTNLTSLFLRVSSAFSLYSWLAVLSSSLGSGETFVAAQML